MGADDDAGCVEHVWRLSGADFSVGNGGSAEYCCTRCAAVMLVPSGGVHPRSA